MPPGRTAPGAAAVSRAVPESGAAAGVSVPRITEATRSGVLSGERSVTWATVMRCAGSRKSSKRTVIPVESTAAAWTGRGGVLSGVTMLSATDGCAPVATRAAAVSRASNVSSARVLLTSVKARTEYSPSGICAKAKVPSAPVRVAYTSESGRWMASTRAPAAGRAVWRSSTVPDRKVSGIAGPVEKTRRTDSPMRLLKRSRTVESTTTW
ncbi:MAG: hypothetical protein AVDCRST_MAG68-2432 [uncultured Gemmatimonadetes bacterium]|uniref:Uncharacterized protein n=1 Tax=uncultured Gemmatimonadota bacterium TaxID=203437 RepID=A0A6J4LE52_9BACT|nr:MAG: hypothetical protein AVDCRST_MAG68-2432 [uncultured Gemmatimonadota bacterium]